MQVSSAGLSEAEGPDSYFARLEIFFTAIFASELALNVLAHFFWPFFMVRTPASQPAASPFRHCIAQKARPWPRGIRDLRPHTRCPRHANRIPKTILRAFKQGEPIEALSPRFAPICARRLSRSPLPARSAADAVPALLPQSAPPRLSPIAHFACARESRL